MKWNNLTFNSFLLISSMLIAGLLSVHFGKELCWDMANYHYYNPYAYWYNRSNWDFFPTSFIHQFINPNIDLIGFYFITHFSSWMTEFSLGAIHGINCFLLYLIARQYLPTQGRIIPLTLSLLGMYGPTVLPGIGSFQNDNFVTLFVLTYVILQTWLIQQDLSNKRLSVYIIFLSGVILGLSLGFKFTAGIFVLGALISTLLLPVTLKTRLHWIIYLSLGCSLGFLCSAGFWLELMWQKHHNPFFPFFNNIFHSPDFPISNFRDTRFLPNNISQSLFFPFYFSWDGRTADASFQDVRFAILYVLFIAGLIKQLFIRTEKYTMDERWLITFFLFSYFAWQHYFSIARYLAALEMLAPLMIYLLLQHLIREPARFIIVAAMIFTFLIAMMNPIPMVRMPWYKGDFFNVQLPEMVSTNENAYVFVPNPAFVYDNQVASKSLAQQPQLGRWPDPRPQTYLIPAFPPTWHFIGIPFWNNDPNLSPQDAATIHQILRDQKPIYLMAAQKNLDTLRQTVTQFGINKLEKCEPIYSDRQKISNQMVLLCKASKG